MPLVLDSSMHVRSKKAAKAAKVTGGFEGHSTRRAMQRGGLGAHSQPHGGDDDRGALVSISKIISLLV